MMTGPEMIRRPFVCILCAALVVHGQPVLGGPPDHVAQTRQQFDPPLGDDPRPVDVVLRADSSIHGHIVDSQGRLRPGLPVMMRYGRSEIVRAQTDSRGGFVLHGIRPGLHQLVTEDGAALLRVWRRTASPPSARSRLLLCTRSTTIRGQGPDVCVDHDACIHEGRCSQCRRSGAFWNPRTADAAVTLGFASAISAISAVMAYEDGKDKAAAGFIANPPPQSP